MGGLNIKLDIIEERIRQLEDRSEGIAHTQYRDQKMLRNKSLEIQKMELESLKLLLDEVQKGKK